MTHAVDAFLKEWALAACVCDNVEPAWANFDRMLRADVRYPAGLAPLARVHRAKSTGARKPAHNLAMTWLG
jgi:hypothetical protein